jgi:hypothetical protein
VKAALSTDRHNAGDDFYNWLAGQKNHPNGEVRFIWPFFFNCIGGSRARTEAGMRRWAARYHSYWLRCFDSAVTEWRLPPKSNVISLAAWRASHGKPGDSA